MNTGEPHNKPSICVHDLISDDAQLHPDRIAVQSGQHKLTYSELDADSDLWADYLSAQGVGPGNLVGVCLPAGVELIIALLGILKAGGAYVPLDPEAPAARLEQIAKAARLSAVVTGPRSSRVAPLTVPHLVFPSLKRWHSQMTRHVIRARRTIDSRQLAYVIYTSGSTGEPKGVLIEHSNLSYSTNVRRIVYPEPIDAFLLVPSFSSDSAVASIYWPLHVGGRLVIASSRTRRDPAGLVNVVRNQHITHVLLSPLLYGAILDIAEPGDLRSLRTVIVAGDKCPSKISQRHLQCLPDATLFNEYGPTEGTVWCSVRRCNGIETGTVPIGRLLPGVTWAIVDPRGNACRPGREGELYIGGPGVARGYFGDPKLTAAKFTADPDAQSGGRVYRTGDLVRLRSDGDLEFIGRTDRQTKIGANRIEPGEIENVLNGHDKIQQAHVTTHEMPDGSHSVIAYCVSPPSAAPEQPKVLARWLRQRLPSVMVPHKFIFVREFPLTANGKIDATRLGANHSTTAMPAPSRHDRSKIESTLIRIWEELLNVSGARLDDSFADLGGDSLRLIRLQSLVKHAFGERVSVAELIRADRMADLVQLISDRVSGFTTPRGDTLRRPVGRLKQRR